VSARSFAGSHEVSRIEGLSDAVFAFAVTLRGTINGRQRKKLVATS
jgi:hypothetical protein